MYVALLLMFFVCSTKLRFASGLEKQAKLIEFWGRGSPGSGTFARSWYRMRSTDLEPFEQVHNLLTLPRKTTYFDQ